MSLPCRRTFLKTALAAVASLFLPRFLLAKGNPRAFWFLHTPTGESWAVDDPVVWSLANAHQPILERARERLVTLDAADPQRVIRLVTRRCQLNMIEISPRRVIVHFWGKQGQGDLRPFFRTHGLATKGVNVALIDRKKECSTHQHGDDFLFGEPLSLFWPWRAYWRKWQRRDMEEADDWTAAPCSNSNYCWEGVEQRRIPWRVLKSAWRHENAPLCPNCDQPTLLAAFGYFACGFYKRGPTVIRICPECRRRFEDHSPWDGPAWMLAKLDEPLLPSCDIMFGHSVKYTLPWTPEGQVHELNLRLVRCLNEIDGRGRFFADTGGHVGRMGKSGSVTMPPFDGPVDGLEAWCRNVIRLLPDGD